MKGEMFLMVRLHDEALVCSSFEVPANAFDSFTMFLLRIMGKPGTLVNSIGDVGTCGFLQEE